MAVLTQDLQILGPLVAQVLVAAVMHNQGGLGPAVVAAIAGPLEGQGSLALPLDRAHVHPVPIAAVAVVLALLHETA